MTMVAGISSSRAARAMAWAWLPEENATTPALRCAGLKRDRALKAPRNLKAPMRCRFSHLRKTRAPSASSSVREVSRSEEHTSELQSQSNLVCRLLLEKKKKKERPYRREDHVYRLRRVICAHE